MRLALMSLLVVGLFLGGFALAEEKKEKAAEKPKEPEEKVIPGGVELGKIRNALPPVKRGQIVVWPALKPAERKKIALPKWDGEKATPDSKEYLEIALSKDRKLFVGGKEVTFKEMVKRILVHAEASRNEKQPTKPSNMPVLLHAYKETNWRNMQWIMQACADPNVRIWRIWLAAQDKDGKPAYVKVFLPFDRGLLLRGPDAPPKIKIELRRKKEDKATRVYLADQKVGSDDAGFKALKTKLADLWKAIEKKGTAELYAWASVPYEDAVKVVEIVQSTGIKTLTFVGAPPPGKRKSKKDEVK